VRGKNESGFTLIELAIVMLIVGILVAVALPRYADLRGNAGDNAVLSTGSSAQAAFAIYVAKNAAKPDCDALAGQMNNLTNYDAATNTGTIVTPASTTTIECTETGTPAEVQSVSIYNNNAATYNDAASALVINF
jgi:prepilin-type N-terminal cleavage/methylation domain-containing protein